VRARIGRPHAGHGVDRDVPKAMALYTAAMEMGSVSAQRRIGIAWETGPPARRRPAKLSLR
jgi:hypothetical protein